MAVSQPATVIWIRRLLALGCAVVVAVMSLLPGDELARIGFKIYNDKVYHGIAYFSLAMLLALGWPRWRLWAIWGLAFLFGAGIEVAQGMTPSRSFDVWDMAANGTGALLALVLVQGWRCWRRR